MDTILRYAALNTGTDFHLLDHLAPLAELLEMPLLTLEELNTKLAKQYYPQIEIRYMPELAYDISPLAAQFDALFECKYWPSNLQQRFQQMYNKKMRLVFCPHGQSDKGFQAPLLAPYALQDIVLLYGDLLIEMLKKLKLWPFISNYIITGNYRLQFYQKHQAFYDKLVQNKFALNRHNKTLIYAPTWCDADRSTSFFYYGSQVISQLPSDWNLLIKLHPLLEQRNPAHFYSITALAEKNQNAFVIHEFPLVYPLLSRADAYLGDASSVGYDFLFFERPLYFFPTHHLGKLHSCGKTISPNKPIYSQIELTNPYADMQKKLYQSAFGSLQPQDALRSQINKILMLT